MSILEKLKAGFRQGSVETDQEILEKHLREREKRRDLMESQRNPSKVAYVAGRTYRSLRPAGRAISRAGGIIYTGARKLNTYANTPVNKRRIRRLSRTSQNISNGLISSNSGKRTSSPAFDVLGGFDILGTERPKTKRKKRRSR